jgi:hypothetical protein
VPATQTGLRCPPVALPSVVGALLPVALSIEPPLPPLQLMRVTQTARRMNMRAIFLGEHGSMASFGRRFDDFIVPQSLQ